MIGQRNWEVTFSDMLMLLLTFMIFIISVSVFKNDEYKSFWKKYNSVNTVNNVNVNSSFKDKASVDSNEIIPFPELNIPKLSNSATSILRQVSEVIDENGYLNVLTNGDSIVYDENRISLMISEDLSFDSGKYKLKAGIKNLLKKFVKVINKYDFPINITGHTDSTIAPKVNNLLLSLDRAVVIADFLINNGVESSRVSVSGYGPYRPIYSNLTKEGRRKNRRVQINIIINRPNEEIK